MSPRYKKPRKCCCPFKYFKERIFKPIGIPMTDLQRTVIYHDELETLRLCDLEDLTQSEAGQRMNISRGTVQRLLASARKKITKAVIEGNAIAFEEEKSKN